MVIGEEFSISLEVRTGGVIFNNLESVLETSTCV